MQSTGADDQPTASASASIGGGVQEANAPSHSNQQSQQRRIVGANGNSFFHHIYHLSLNKSKYQVKMAWKERVKSK